MVKILVIDDDHKWHSLWEVSLGKNVEIFHAFSIKEGRENFKKNSDVDIIVVDACVPGTHLNTIDIVKELRKKFKGTMIAVSSNAFFMEELVAAGCDLECEKYLLPQKILELFP